MPITVLFFVSGAASLLFQTVFLRQMTWLAGSAAGAVAATVAVFLGGLGAGAALFGPRADRSGGPLGLYGRLEIAAAGSALVVAALLGPWRGAVLPGASAVGGALLIFVPAVFMGGTLPALVAHAAVREEAWLAPLGRLYAINTLGAAAGALVGGTVLLERCGVFGTALVAAALAALAGAIALALSRATPLPARQAPPKALRAGTVRASVRRASVGAAVVSGAAVVGYEVLWTRLLALPLRSYAYSFSVMLAIYLVGLVAGSAAASRLAAAIRNPGAWLGASLLLLGAWVASSLWWMPSVLTPPSEAGSFAVFLARGALQAAVVVLPATALSGFALPVAARTWGGAAAGAGRDVGLVFAANTAGAVVGALAAGLVLLPALGAPRSLAALAALHVVAGAAMLAIAAPRWRVVAFAAAAASLVVAWAPAAPYSASFLAATRGRETLGDVLYFREGATDTVAVVRRNYGFHDPDAKSVLTNGIAMTATVKPVWRYMAAEGHLPALLAPDPSRSLVICVGTGITLGALVSHDRVKVIDAVDLSEGILEALPLFEKENGAAYRDPKVRLVHADGRRFLETTDALYGAATLEPPPPVVAGSVNLYTLDFYRALRRRLAPGAVVAQWLPLHAQSLASARLAARTFLAAFPHAQLWLPSVRDAILIGSDHPLSLPAGRLRAAFADDRTRRNLSAALIETPQALTATLRLDREGIGRWAGDGDLLTDDRPRMEFFRGLGPNMTDRDIATLLDAAPAPTPWLDGPDSDPALAAATATEARALACYLDAEVRGRAEAGVEAARLSSGTAFFRYRLGCAPDQLAFLESSTARGAAWHDQARRCATLDAEPSLP